MTSRLSFRRQEREEKNMLKKGVAQPSSRSHCTLMVSKLVMENSDLMMPLKIRSL
jgi:hypothetical protein